MWSSGRRPFCPLHCKKNMSGMRRASTIMAALSKSMLLQMLRSPAVLFLDICCGQGLRRLLRIDANVSPIAITTQYLVLDTLSCLLTCKYIGIANWGNFHYQLPTSLINSLRLQIKYSLTCSADVSKRHHVNAWLAYGPFIYPYSDQSYSRRGWQNQYLVSKMYKPPQKSSHIHNKPLK